MAVHLSLSRKEAQALARAKHTKSCAYVPFGGERCTCGFVAARKHVREMLRMTA